MLEIVKVGSKGRHVVIPDGWRIVYANEKMSKGDKVCNIYSGEFEDIEQQDYEYSLLSEIYELVIRNENPLNHLQNGEGKMTNYDELLENNEKAIDEVEKEINLINNTKDLENWIILLEKRGDLYKERCRLLCSSYESEKEI
jgi:bifunctional DNA-binding transcriptional regulator/antitoxin component of YhaV-PrlF toxin-antitoxin module